MKEYGSLRFALWGSAVSTAAGLVLVLSTLSSGGLFVRWSLLGWGVMTAVGIAGGSWMIRLHGKPGTAFLGAVLGCIFARLIGSALGAWAATPIGLEAARPYVLGLGVGYVPLQMFEAKWLMTRSKTGTHDGN